MTLLEDFFNLLKRSSDGFWVHEEDMDESSKIERSKYEVSFPCDFVKARRDGVCESKVEKPVSCLIFVVIIDLRKSESRNAYRCQRYCFPSDF